MSALKDSRGNRTLDRFLFKCNVCEHVVRHEWCIYRCGYPICCSCTAVMFGRPDDTKLPHPRQPPLECRRNAYNCPPVPGIPPELKEPKVINTMYFRPQWHYRPWRSSVIPLRDLPK